MTNVRTANAGQADVVGDRTGRVVPGGTGAARANQSAEAAAAMCEGRSVKMAVA